MSAPTAPVLAACVICGSPGDVAVDPPRRTMARGVDPDDPSIGIIAVLPDISLCAAHAAELGDGTVAVGWCDDESCRCYGSVGNDSTCGRPFLALRK